MAKKYKSSDKVMGNECEDTTGSGGDHHWRQSMDRFGDDLTELIISYLTIGDKMCVQCVSRQWLRLIFNKQVSLRVTNIRTSDDYINGLVVSRPSNRYPDIDLRAFDVVLRRLNHLQSIRIEGRITVKSSVIALIADTCPQLQNLWIAVRYIHDINAQCLRDFGRKCGHSLRSFKFDGLTDKQMKQLFCFTPNLRAITVDNVRTIIAPLSGGDDSASPLATALLPNLQELQFCRCGSSQLQNLSIQYHKTVTKIKTHLLTIDLRGDEMDRALAGFGKFESLVSLDVFVDVCDADVHPIDTGLAELAVDARRLKHLYFTLDGNLLQTNLFETFGRFRTLQTLEIIITSDPELGQYSYTYGSIDAFKYLSQLRHLNLHLDQLNDENVVNIDKYLPHLVSLRMNTSKAISDLTLRSVAKLRRLSKLEIICLTAEDSDNITDEGVCHVIGSCDRIQSLSFDQKNPSFDFEISKQSVDAIVSRAERVLKVQHNFSFAINTKPNETLFQSYYPSIQLPFNLSIEVL